MWHTKLHGRGAGPQLQGQTLSAGELHAWQACQPAPKFALEPRSATRKSSATGAYAVMMTGTTAKKFRRRSSAPAP
jgi:hypothetical protein